MYRIIVPFLFLLVGCNNYQVNQPVKLFGEAQGTYYSIIYYDNESRDLQYEIDSILSAFDNSVSLWVENSIISRVNNNDTSVELDKWFIENFHLSMDVSEKTNGSFDLTVGAMVRAWGFGFDDKKRVDEKIIDSILQFTGYKKVSIVNGKVVKDDERTTFDFNAVAQGYSVDLISEFLESYDIENYLVDIGGEVRGKGEKPGGESWKVGIEKPAKNRNDERDLKAVVELKGRSIATSGNYRKFYEENGIRYSHTINPKTGYPARHSLLSVSVIAGQAAIADAYATAFMVMGLDESKTFLVDSKGLEAFFIFSDGEGNYSTYATDGFQSLITKSFE